MAERARWQARIARSAAAAAFGAALTLARSGAAHIDLARPQPREQGRSRAPNADLKEGPCGQVVNGRTEKVNVFEPGETIEIVWAETTNHRSYYRIAFDRDGDDAFPVFAGPGLGAAGIDPSGPCPVDGQVILAYDMDDREGGSHTLVVRLPEVECENCTLQVVQYMFDTTRPYYFQCADLALRRRPDAGATAPADAGVENATAAPACWSRIAPADAGRRPASEDDDEGPAPSDGGAPRPDAPQTPPSEPVSSVERSGGGCALAAQTQPSSSWWLLAFGVVGVGRRMRVVRARRSAERSPTRNVSTP